MWGGGGGVHPQTPAIKQLTLKMSIAAQRRYSTVWGEPCI